MHFNDFLLQAPKVLNVELPAANAHRKMVPPNREELIKNTNFSIITPKKAAVLMLFYPKNSQTHLALILRTTYNGVHSSQIAFPGGKVETGERPEDALIRELKEELNINVEHSCLAPLTFASHAYEDFHLLMPLYVCRRWQGIPQPMEGQELKWVRANDLRGLPMPPADLPLIPHLEDLL